MVIAQPNNDTGSTASGCSEALTFGSLFAGIGGFDLGFERAGMVCKWQVEIDGYCQRVLAKHWPNVRRWDDVRTWPQPDTEPVDVICGGFPCQDISHAGLGAGLDGERSGLFFETVRVVGQCKPRFVVLENVAALLTRGLDRVLRTLAAIGYDAEWYSIKASDVGLPHRRERVFIIAHRDGLRQLQSNRGFGDQQRRYMHRREGIDWVLSSGGILRSDDGIPARLDRIGQCGNAVVPQVAEWIGRRIVEVAGRKPASDLSETEAGCRS